MTQHQVVHASVNMVGARYHHRAFSREHEGTERETEGVGCDMSWSLKLFLVSGSLFSETSAREIRKAKFNDNGGFVVGTHKHFPWRYKRSLFFVVYKRSLLAGYAKN